MKTINITVKNKIAALRGEDTVVNGNSDIMVRFDFDDEWSNTDTKTAVFVTSDGTAFYETIEGGTCMMPVLYNTAYVKIGVISSELKTSTAATVPCAFCVRDEVCAEGNIGNDMYTQLLALIDECYTKNEVYSKEEADIMHTLYAYRRITLTEVAAYVELNDRVDINAENVGKVCFTCNSGCMSNILIKTAETGEISVSFEGVIDYAGDYCDILGNGEVWEFNIMNNRCIGRRWSA